MSKVVVTGGAGFIGSHLVEGCLAQGFSVTVLDDLSSGRKENLPKGVNFIEGSFLDPSSLKRAFEGAETVFHLAALISVPESIQQKRRYLEVNSVGMVGLLDAAVEAGVKNVIFSSSAAVYGENPSSPKFEHFVPQPLSPYALNKLDGEYLLQMYAKEFGIHGVSLRYFNVFGPRQNPKSAYAAAVPIFFDRAVKNEPISVFGDGEQTRDFIFVKDVVQANLLAAKSREKLSATSARVFNVASGNSVTINDLVNRIIKMTGSSSEVRYLPAREGEIKHSLGNSDLIRETLGFSPQFDLDSGLSAIF